MSSGTLPYEVMWTEDYNDDKPHRCPKCHMIAERAWSHRGYGPRTIFRCLHCHVKWRAGVRVKSYRRVG